MNNISNNRLDIANGEIFSALFQKVVVLLNKVKKHLKKAKTETELKTPIPTRLL